jgi:integrase
MKAESTVKTWNKTRLQNLVCHKSGRYYARLFLNGKEIWKSLKTSHFSVAEAKLAELQKEHRARRAKDVDPANAKMTFGQAATLHMRRLEERVTIKKRTRKYWKETLEALLKSWPELPATEIRKVTPAACRDWSARYAKIASSNRYNNSLSLLRHVLNVGIESGVIYTNAAVGLERVTIRPKQLELPTRAKFAEFIAEMRRVHSRDSANCADFVQGLAFTGCRIGESAEIEWKDLDFDGGEIVVKGDPEEGTKNGEIRRVPMIPEARELFMKMRQERGDEPQTAKVFLVHESQKSINRAAKKTGMARITHHDLRHFFATVSIESGVDIPTVSRWLGHKDGGALAMRTYGHLRREHSVAQAQKVSFAPTLASPVSAS